MKAKIRRQKAESRTRRLRLFLPSSFWFLTFFGVCCAEVPRPGDPVDLARFGHAKTWDGNRGVEWDEPREVK